MSRKWIACLLLAGLLIGCTMACSRGSSEIASMSSSTEEAETTSPREPGEQIVTVSTIDEFLAALNSGTAIHLKEGSYHLDEASDYGKDSDNPAYYWEDIGDGYQLVLNHLHDLIIEGSGKDVTCLLTSPRYANIISFEGCKRIFLNGFTAGHTQGGALCTGGVLDFSDSQEISLSQMGLFGCGIRGVNLYNCRNAAITDSVIYDCSLSGVDAQGCTSLSIQNSEF